MRVNALNNLVQIEQADAALKRLVLPQLVIEQRKVGDDDAPCLPLALAVDLGQFVREGHLFSERGRVRSKERGRIGGVQPEL